MGKQAPVRSSVKSFSKKPAPVESSDDEQLMELDGSDEEIELDPQELIAFNQLKRQQQDDDDEEEDDEEEEEAAAEAEEEADESMPVSHAKQQKTQFINNKVGLESKLQDIRFPPNFPWIETLTITSQKALDLQDNDVHDDLKREAAFYNMSVSAATAGLAQLASLNIPYRIPSDYYAEKVKPDKFMNKIKDRLIEEQQKMESVEKRKALKEQQRYSKQVQAQIMQQKAKEKKANLESAKQLRKDTANQELSIERSTLPGVQEHLQHNKVVTEKKLAKRNFKREQKNAKYGFGGKKKYAKSNDVKSAHSYKDYSIKNNKTLPKGFTPNKPGSFGGGGRSNSFKGKSPSYQVGRASPAARRPSGKSKPNRPGKAKRAANRK